MRIWVLSDIHNEVSPWEPPSIPDADLCILAGDTAKGAAATVEWAAKHIRRHMPVIGVLGNHEAYDGFLDAERFAAQQHGWRRDIVMLDDMTWHHEGTRFIGATLWTDFDLDAKGDEVERQYVMMSAQAGIRDYSRIRMEGHRFTPAVTRRLHQRSVEYIESVLTRPFDGPTVVVTHHAPSPRSINKRFEGDGHNPVFVSDLGWLIERYQPELWIHGHVHDNVDAMIGNTRLLCNPRDYYGGNPKFDPCLVIDTDDLIPPPPGP